MARLFDDVRANLDPKQYDDASAFEQAVVFVAQNVADYCNPTAKSPSKHLHDEQMEALPHVVPPFPVCWVEFRLPEIGGIGWMVTRQDVNHLRSAHDQAILDQFRTENDDLRWYIRANLFLARTSPRLMPQAACTLLLNSQGRLVRFFQEAAEVYDADGSLRHHQRVSTLHALEIPPSSAFAMIQQYIDKGMLHGDGEALLRESSQFILYAVRICMWVFAFVHLKNVVIEEIEPPTKVQQRRARDGKLPLTRYRTIRVRQMNVKRGDPKGGHHAKPAFHIVHGHFRTFDESAPLFGRHVGTYWWDSFARGDRSRGEVKKDYEVLAEGEIKDDAE